MYEKALIKSISQKGSNIYQDFKVTKVVPQDPAEYGGKEYVICDFKYTLLTGAGFEVDRKGVASLTSEGTAVEVLWTASTRERYVMFVFVACRHLIFSATVSLIAHLVLHNTASRRLNQLLEILPPVSVSMLMV